MNLRFSMTIVVCVVALTMFVSGQESLVLVRTMELPQVEGRIDHLAVDGEQQRLFVAALGNNSLEVLDLKSGARIQSGTGLGLAIVKRAVKANGGHIEVEDGRNGGSGSSA